MRPLLLAYSLIAIALPAQSPQEPLIRVTTRVVEVNVVVRDHKGPVTGLTKDDFVLLDRNKPQRISFFSVTSTAHPAVSPAPVEPLPPNVFTNQQAQASAANATIVLLDGINTESRDQHYVRLQFLKFLSQMRSTDRVAVYALGQKLYVLNDFTSEVGKLAAAANRYAGEAQSLLATSHLQASSTEDFEIDSWLNDSNGVMADRAIADRARTTAIALESIARHIANVPGRKSLIWISGSFPYAIGHFGADGPANWEDFAFDQEVSGARNSKQGMGGASKPLYGVNIRDGNPARDQMNFAKDVERATRALNDANIAVYPVDARGLTTMPKEMTAEGMVPQSRSQAIAPPKAVSTVPTGWQSMQTIAGATGGVVFQNTNDIHGAIRTAIDDSEVTYTLGFYPAAADDKFHDLKVQVKRKDVELRYRKGYIAATDGAPNAAQRGERVREAIESSLDATALSLTAALETVGEPKPHSLRITVAIDPHQLSIEHNGSRYIGGFDVLFAPRSTEGKSRAIANQPLTLNMDQQHYDALMASGLTITKTLDPTPEMAQVRIVVVDRSSGKVGSLSVPIPSSAHGVH